MRCFCCINLAAVHHHTENYNQCRRRVQNVFLALSIFNLQSQPKTACEADVLEVHFVLLSVSYQSHSAGVKSVRAVSYWEEERGAEGDPGVSA